MRDPVHALKLVTLLLAFIACAAESAQALKRRPPGLLDFIVVPRPPPVVPVEIQPPTPDEAAIWIGGQWVWEVNRWRWEPGSWMIPPDGATLSFWTYAYQEDGRVHFWPATWADARGKPMAEPPRLASARRQLEPR